MTGRYGKKEKEKKMKRDKFGWGMVFMLFFIPVFVAACGGDGGGDGVESITYTGNSAQASITNSSAETIALDAYEGGEMGGNITDLMDIAPMGGVPGPTSPAVNALNRALSGVPRFTQSGSMPGNCPGNPGGAAYNITFNETTGDFSFSFAFQSFCTTDGLVQTVLNGAISFIGKINIAGDYPEHMTATFANLTSVASDGSENITLSGSVSLTMSSPTPGTFSGTMTMNFVTRDNVTGKTYWVDNYVANMTDNGSYEEVSVSGRFCHHDQGCVDLSTPTSLQNYPLDEHPYTGVLQFDGSGGTSVQLTFVDQYSYQVTADTDGDLAYDDFDSGVKYWQ